MRPQRQRYWAVCVGALVVMAAAGACTWTVEPRVHGVLETPVELRYGWTVVWPQADLTLRFDQVVSDDRCPRQVICEWAGEARLRVTVQAGNFPARHFEMSTYPYWGEDQIRYAGYAIRLIDVAPYPERPNEERGPEDYRITLSTGAVSTEPLAVYLDAGFQLQVEQRTSLVDDDLVIIWERLLDDSRCPAMVSCVWNGEARVAVSWVFQGSDGQAELTTNPGAGASEVGIGPYRLRLLGVTPYPQWPDETIRLPEYAARWVIQTR